uniref:Transposase n=1 Tax=Ditylenchus dipsaci TaxID=166011 RepID=A0A915CV50_9BILA
MTLSINSNGSRNDEKLKREPFSIKHDSNTEKKAGFHMESISEKVNKDGVEMLSCSQCNQNFKSPSPSTVLKNHWQAKHKNIALACDIESIGSNVLPPNKSILSKKIEEAFSEVLAIPALPINIFLNPKMRKFIELLNQNFPLPKCHKTMKTILFRKSEEVIEKLKHQFSNLTIRPSITVDIWTDESLKNSYLGVTMHLIKVNSLQRVFLGLRHLKFSHTAEYIRAETEELLQVYGLDLSKVFKVVTDNGSNMKNAFMDETQLVTNADEFNDDDWMKMRTKTLTLFDAFPRRLSCFAHTLQLVLMKIFKKNLVQAPAFVKMAGFIRRFKYSSDAKTELFRSANKMLISPSSTRWGSSIEVIQVFLELKEYLTDIATKKHWPFPTSEEIQQLKNLSKLLKPFADMLRRVQAENTVTISSCVKYIRALFLWLEDCQASNEEPVLTDVFEDLKSQLKEYFKSLLNEILVSYDQIYMIACAVDPRMFGCLSDDEIAKVADWIRQMLPADEAKVQAVQYASKSNQNSTLDNLMSRVGRINETRNIRDPRQGKSKNWVTHALRNAQEVVGKQ